MCKTLAVKLNFSFYQLLIAVYSYSHLMTAVTSKINEIFILTLLDDFNC